MRISALMTVPSLLAFWGCAAVQPPATTAMAQPSIVVAGNETAAIVIEAENMALTDGEIVSDAAASGDKAVKLLSEKTVGTTEFNAPKGEYLVTAHVFAPDMEHDAFYLGIDETQVMRMFPRRHNRWAYSAKLLIFRAEKSGAHALKFAISWPKMERGKTGILLDRIEIVPLDKAPSYLEKWQR